MTKEDIKYYTDALRKAGHTVIEFPDIPRPDGPKTYAATPYGIVNVSNLIYALAGGSEDYTIAAADMLQYVCTTNTYDLMALGGDYDGPVHDRVEVCDTARYIAVSFYESVNIERIADDCRRSEKEQGKGVIS